MPRGLEPGIRLPIVLDVDKGKENPPTFYAKALSARAALPISAALEHAIETNLGSDDAITRIEEAIKTGLCGWENLNDASGQPIHYGNGTALGDILDRQELCQLLAGIYSGGNVSPDDKKKLESPG